MQKFKILHQSISVSPGHGLICLQYSSEVETPPPAHPSPPTVVVLFKTPMPQVVLQGLSSMVVLHRGPGDWVTRVLHPPTLAAARAPVAGFAPHPLLHQLAAAHPCLRGGAGAGLHCDSSLPTLLRAILRLSPRPKHFTKKIRLIPESVLDSAKNCSTK